MIITSTFYLFIKDKKHLLLLKSDLMSDFVTKLGRRIRELRKQKRYSQEKLAEKSDISSKDIGEIERGETNLSVSVMYEIGGALESSVAKKRSYKK